jgi:hypothetical protein
MSDTRKLYAESGKIYFIRESGGTFYVSTTTWFPGGESTGMPSPLKMRLP